MVRTAVSGWQLSSVGLIRSGIAATVGIGVNTSGNTDTTNQRPNYNAGVSQYLGNGPNGYLNPAAFSIPAKGTYGNLGRNTFFGPGYAQEDVSLIKDTPLGEGRAKLQFRAEVFNVLNHTNFDEPVLTYGTTGFGTILNTFGRTLGSGVNRDIQLALKLMF